MMKWLNMELPADQVALARTRPALYVARSSYLFAGTFTFLWVLLTALFPAWDIEFDARRLVFVAVFGGVLASLMNLGIARRLPDAKK